MDERAASFQRIVTRSGRSFGSGQLGGSGVFRLPQGAQPSSTASLAAHPTAEEEVRHTMESRESHSSAAEAGQTQPVSSLPQAAVEFNTGDRGRHELLVDPYLAPCQFEFDDSLGNYTSRMLDISTDNNDNVNRSIKISKPHVLNAPRLLTHWPGIWNRSGQSLLG